MPRGVKKTYLDRVREALGKRPGDPVDLIDVERMVLTELDTLELDEPKDRLPWVRLLNDVVNARKDWEARQEALAPNEIVVRFEAPQAPKDETPLPDDPAEVQP